MSKNAATGHRTNSKPRGTGAAGPIAVILLILGVLLAGWTALTSVSLSLDPNRPECGGKVMHPGDKCVEFGGKNNGKTTTFEEEAQKVRDGQEFAALTRAFSLPGMIVCFVGAVVLLVVRARRKRALAAAAAWRTTPV